jgi:epoxyqueuosine reductase
VSDPKTAIREQALGTGFTAVGFAEARLAAEAGARLRSFLAAGWQGDMGWLAREPARRSDPRALWPAAQSVVALGASYAPADDPLAAAARKGRGAISVYARTQDYHDVLKRRLKALGQWIAATYQAEVKVFVDTAPVMEKPLAAQAGLGWQGKHTNLVSRAHGSWLFLGEILTTLDLAPDPPAADHCGSCRRCLEACPTGALPAPYRLDARRCISYLTIEHKGHIAPELRPLIGTRVYGCDDCLAVCPWNRFARAASDRDLAPRIELMAPRLTDLAALDDATFRAVFAGTAIKRTGRDRFVRNVLIAIANDGDPAALPVVEARLDDASPLVRAMAVWALKRLAAPEAFAAERARRQPQEADPAVHAEWAGEATAKIEAVGG